MPVVELTRCAPARIAEVEIGTKMMSKDEMEVAALSTEDDLKIGPDLADEGAALLFTAIGELAEDVSADAVMMRKDGQTIWVMRAERLQAFGLDVATLAKAIEVLGRRREPSG